jgi:hypothetical protein
MKHSTTYTVLHGRTEEIITILTAVTFAGFRGLGGCMKEETLAPAVGFGLTLQKTAIMSRYTLNLQATQRNYKHHSDSSGTTANLQTPQ